MQNNPIAEICGSLSRSHRNVPLGHLYVIAENCLLNGVRKSKRNIPMSTIRNAETLFKASGSPDQFIDNETIRQYLDLVNNESRVIFRLKLTGLTFKEIAKELGKDPKVIEKRYERGLKVMQKAAQREREREREEIVYEYASDIFKLDVGKFMTYDIYKYRYVYL